MIEVEVRSFISEDEYDRLIKEMEEKGEKVKEDKQITYYFSGDEDLRIQKNNSFAKLWMKGGDIHDDDREEFEVEFDRDDFQTLKEILEALGYEVEIKWYRKRHKFRWKGFDVCVDYTPGYGRIVEIEKLCEEGDEEGKYGELLDALEELGVEETPDEEFDEAYERYKNNWKDILKERDLTKL